MLLERPGRFTKWAIELGENDIQYTPRTSIKGEGLADFVIEIPDETPRKVKAGLK